VDHGKHRTWPLYPAAVPWRSNRRSGCNSMFVASNTWIKKLCEKGESQKLWQAIGLKFVQKVYEVFSAVSIPISQSVWPYELQRKTWLSTCVQLPIHWARPGSLGPQALACKAPRKETVSGSRPVNCCLEKSWYWILLG
jgi:hypothetical protein